MARISYDPSVRAYRAPGGPGRVTVDVKAAERAALASGAVETALFDAAGELTQVAMKGLEQRNKQNFEADLKATEIKFKEWDTLAEAELKDIQITENYEQKSSEIVARYQKLADDWIADGNIRGYGRREVKMAVDNVKNQWSSGLESGRKAFGIAWDRETTRRKLQGNTSSHLADPSKFNSSTFGEYQVDLRAELDAGIITQQEYNRQLLTGRTTIFNQLDKVDIAAAENAVNNNDMALFESLRQQVIDRGNLDEEIVNNKFDAIPDSLAAATVRNDIAAAGNDLDELEFIQQSLIAGEEDHYANLRAYNQQALLSPLARKIVQVKTAQNSNLLKQQRLAEEGEFDMNLFMIASAQNDENGLGLEEILDDPSTLDIDESKTEIQVVEEMGLRLQKISDDKVRLDEIRASKAYRDVRAGLLNIAANPRMKQKGGAEGKLESVEQIMAGFIGLSTDAKHLMMSEFLNARAALYQKELGHEVTDNWYPNFFKNISGRMFRDDSYIITQDVIDGSKLLLDAWQSKYRAINSETREYEPVLDPISGGPVDMAESLVLLEKVSKDYLERVSEMQATKRENGQAPTAQDYINLARQSYLEMNLARENLERILSEQ